MKKTINPNPPADFTPEMGKTNDLGTFRAWCRYTLPMVFDDSASYYELLCRVVDYLNKTMENVDTLETDVNNLHDAYVQLQNYVNHYFDSLDVQEEINNKLDEMIENGEFNQLFKKFIPYGTPEMFGAIGDGIHDDTEAFIECIKNYDKIVGTKGKKYRATITINKSNFSMMSCYIIGSIIIENNLRFITLEDIEVDANISECKKTEYCIYADNTVTKLVMNNCYLHGASICGLYLNNSWDYNLTNMSISDNELGAYLFQFNSSTFRGTFYNNGVGLQLYGTTSCNIFATIQENKRQGAIIKSTHSSLLKLYLEQNGWNGTDLNTKSQVTIGADDATCINNLYLLYGMGGHGSEKTSDIGALFYSVNGGLLLGYFQRHNTTGVRLTSTVSGLICKCVDLNHKSYDYDLITTVFIPTIMNVKTNTVINIDTSGVLSCSIMNNTPVKYSIEKITSNTCIIRTDSGTEEDAILFVYYPFKTSTSP